MLDQGAVMEAHYSPLDVESESVTIAAPVDFSSGNGELQLIDALDGVANVYEIPVDVGEKSIPISNERMSAPLSLFQKFEHSRAASVYEIPVDVGEISIPISNERMSAPLSLFEKFEQSTAASVDEIPVDVGEISILISNERMSVPLSLFEKFEHSRAASVYEIPVDVGEISIPISNERMSAPLSLFEKFEQSTAASVDEIPVDMGEISILISNERMSVPLSLFEKFEQSYWAQLEAQKREKMRFLPLQREMLDYNHKSCIVTRIDYKKSVDGTNTSSKLPKNFSGSNSLHADGLSMLNLRSEQIDNPSASSFPSPTSCVPPAVNLFNSDLLVTVRKRTTNQSKNQIVSKTSPGAPSSTVKRLRGRPKKSQ